MKTALGVFVGMVMLSACEQRLHCDYRNYLTTVEIRQDSIDIGYVNMGDSIEIPYVLKNSGSSALLIKDIIPSCDCTTASFSSKEVAPGDSTTIVLTYRAEDSAGYLYRTAEIVCNTRQHAELTFTGHVMPSPRSAEM